MQLKRCEACCWNNRGCAATVSSSIFQTGKKNVRENAKQVPSGGVEQGRHGPERHKDDLGRRHSGSRGQPEGCTPLGQDTALCLTGEPMNAASLGTISRYYNHGWKTTMWKHVRVQRQVHIRIKTWKNLNTGSPSFSK